MAEREPLVRRSGTERSFIRNLTCLLPDGHIPVTYWARHPCDDSLYMHAAYVIGPNGFVGYWIPRGDDE